uniref:S-protein homolog n=1 Tax=Manihot esculenta TaxID=3983 RepID=A0A2C9VZ09_MANES
MIVISNQKFIFCVILVLSTMSVSLSAEKSIINKIIDFLVPLIKMRLTNNAMTWCYLHLNDTNHGVFWTYQVRLGCSQCNWTIQDNGLFLFKDNNFKEPHSLFINGKYF